MGIKKRLWPTRLKNTGSRFDEEVKKVLDTAYAEAKQMLLQHRDKLELVGRENFYSAKRLTPKHSQL